MTHLERRGAFTLACIAVGLLVSPLPDDTGGDFAGRLERAIEHSAMAAARRPARYTECENA